MIDIKFRAWLPDYELMIDENFDGVDGLQFEDVRWDLSCGIAAIYVDEIFDIESGGEHVQGYEFKLQKDAAIMQYTGLKDKNGVDIYEGDVVMCYPDDERLMYSKEVKWAKDRPELGITTDSSGLILCSSTTKYILVIGNIHTNPELLKGE